MDKENDGEARERDEDEQDQAVVAARGGVDGHQRQPALAALLGQAAADDLAHAAADQVDDRAGEDAEQEAERRGDAHGRLRGPRDLVGVPGGVAPGPAEEGDAVGAHEAGGGERRRERH